MRANREGIDARRGDLFGEEGAWHAAQLRAEQDEACRYALVPVVVVEVVEVVVVVVVVVLVSGAKRIKRKESAKKERRRKKEQYNKCFGTEVEAANNL